MTYLSPELLNSPLLREATAEYHDERDATEQRHAAGEKSPAHKPHLVIAAPAQQANGKQASPPKLVSARELLGMEFEPVKYVVPGYVAEGATILAGRPKLGKSWMALEMAIAVATGGACLGGIQCEQGDVLYLALEDNQRRLQSRLDRILPAGSPGPAGLHFATEWPRANEGGLKYLREWLERHPAARLVVVDILTMFRDVRNGKDTPYESDYAAVKGLQTLAMEKGVAVLIVHHTRKGSGEGGDAFEKVSGTLGLSGAADTTLVLDRDGNGATLYGRGRDIEEIETAVTFDRDLCRWSVIGQASEVRKTDERKEILDVLKDADEPMTPSEIAGALGVSSNNIKQLLFKMAKAGEVVKSRTRGRYLHPDRPDLDNPHTPDNPDNRITGQEGEDGGRDHD
ncbi:AAA family ATPase [Methylocystis sp. JAN1]|uniref:AAA family ATPase n=1 Tax=Methylocystis sp. JAN1 TaxID=3397211 RepID=UPI003FA2FA96